jgi:FixJ family two-component response regulator
LNVTSAARVVYVVDADAAVREAIARLLDAAGLEARPRESLAGIPDHPPGHDAGCILLDLSGMLPVEDALRTGLGERCAAMPIIAMSTRDDDRTRRLAHDLGAQAFFRKPVDGAALIDAIAWVTRTDSARPA